MGRQAKLRASRKKKAAPVFIQYTPDWSNFTQDSFAEYIQNCADLGSGVVLLSLTNLANFIHLRFLTQGQQYPIPVYIQLNTEEEEADI
jgi:hypothetical protein